MEYIIPDCKQVLVPFNEEDYHKILVNTSQEVFNKLIEIWDGPVSSKITRDEYQDIKYIAELIEKDNNNNEEPLLKRRIKYVAEPIGEQKGGAESEKIKDIKIRSLRILITQYHNLLEQASKKINELKNIQECFNQLAEYVSSNTNSVPEKLKKECVKKGNSKLIFTRGILDYLDRLDLFFKYGNENDEFINDIPKSILMVTDIMNYLIEQIYIIRESNDIKKRLRSEGKKINAIVIEIPQK